LLRELVRILGRYLRAIFFGWLSGIARILRRCRWRRRADREDRIGERGFSRTPCAPVSRRIYRRPDPLLYSQSYLMAQGLGVTWDNPDIQLLRDGFPVSSHDLIADEEYEVAITVWNGSNEAPVAGLPVKVSYLDFGIGALRIPIEETTVNLPVRGAPGHPATARVNWRTPSTPGHYCLLAELVWADDANPANNVGQENTRVVAATSPATFELAVRNAGKVERQIWLEADAYALPALPLCEPTDAKGEVVELDWLEEDERRRQEQRRRRGRREEALAQHRRDRFPLPEGWTVRFGDQKPLLGADEERLIPIEIEPTAEFHGRRPINLNAFTDSGPLGGVTIYVER
jgi:hypothetical protein